MKNINLIGLTLKKANFLFLSFAVCLLFLSALGASPVKAQPNAAFDKMWVDYGVKEGTENGMRLHIKFTANDLKSTDCQVRIIFYYDDEKPLKDNNQRFYTTTGNVAVFKDLKPAFDPAEYNDLQIFMPYSELELNYGSYKLKMDVDLIYKDGELIQHMSWYDFTYDKKAPASATPSVTFERMWIEYDVTEKGQFGMRIHSKFTVDDMKGVDGYLVFFFDRGTTETRLKSYDNKFQSKANDVAVYRSIKPAYEPADYNDLDAFIPYSELHLTKGEHNLRIDADLIYENGTFIQHLGFEKFRYWKQ